MVLIRCGIYAPRERREEAPYRLRRDGTRAYPVITVYRAQRLIEGDHDGIIPDQDGIPAAGRANGTRVKSLAVLPDVAARHVRRRADVPALTDPIRLTVPYRIRGDGTGYADTEG
jgi:hypothetical protein